MNNFREAAIRHYNDAELLLNNTRQANAGQLHGFAAECGLKALLIWHGHSVDPVAGNIDKKFYYHVDLLINTIASSLSGRGADKYLAMIPNIGKFSTWNVSHRYWSETALPKDFTGWRNATIEIMNMLDQAVADGVIK